MCFAKSCLFFCRSNGTKNVRRKLKPYYFVNIINRSNIFSGTNGGKKTEDLGSRTACQSRVYEKRDNMAQQAIEQTGVEKKRSRLLFGRFPLRISKGKPATLPEIPSQVPGPIRENFEILPRLNHNKVS